MGINDNPYEPRAARITGVKNENAEIKTFDIRMADGGGDLKFFPGQFIQLSVPGVGEAPISICSSPLRTGSFEISVREVGSVTNALFQLQKGDEVGIRGPFGNGYPLKKLLGKRVVVVAGGIGIPPLASLVECLTCGGNARGKILLLYGAKSPQDLIFADRLAAWKKNGVDVMVTVDKGDETWRGEVGVVTNLFGKRRISGEAGVTCGPPVMMKFAVQSLRSLGIKDRNIYLSLERMMQCGIGKCGHCNIGEKYVCIDGPVFSAEELNALTENAWR